MMLYVFLRGIIWWSLLCSLPLVWGPWNSYFYLATCTKIDTDRFTVKQSPVRACLVSHIALKFPMINWSLWLVLNL